jgi:hypothetical protein
VKKSEAERLRLREDVMLMREIGVLEWKDIKLGASPAPPRREVTEEEARERLMKREERNHDILFAATPVRPPLRKG